MQIEFFKKLGFFVNIEAAGTRVVDSIFDNVHFISFDQLRIAPQIAQSKFGVKQGGYSLGGTRLHPQNPKN